MLLCGHAMVMSLGAFVGCGLYGFVGGEEDRHSLGGERGCTVVRVVFEYGEDVEENN